MTFTTVLETLETLGIPLALAIKAALVLAKDDPSEPNLGRTEEDNQDIWQAWKFIKQQEDND